MPYAYIFLIESLSNYFPVCSNRPTGCTVFLKCDMWLQSKIEVGL